MIDKVINYIEDNRMFSKGDKVVVGVSGGPDSICLLHILHVLKERLEIELVGAHINHCLRGEEADKDEYYVRKFCENIGIECFVKRIDVHKVSKEKGISSETAGREVRYEFFKEVLEKTKGQKIAVAHNANDQAETVLMRVMRGAGLEGLGGIKAVRDGIYVRPILHISRKEIEEYCESNNLMPRIDKTNLESIFTRNKIRLELIPYIENNFNKDIVEGLNRLVDTIRKDNDYMNALAEEKYRKYCKSNVDKVIIYKDAFKEDEAILTRVIRWALNELKGDLRNFERIHVYDIINLQIHSTGKRVMLPNNIEALNNYGDIHIYIKKSKKLIVDEEYRLKIDYENVLDKIGLKISLRIIEKNKIEALKKDSLAKYFDYNKIEGDITLRYRRNGDKFTPLGMKGSKKLKDLFIDLKIPQSERDRIPLICFGDEIAWVAGYRVSDKFKTDDNTQNILQIKIEREE